ncbi:hypothetical protein TrVE_jg6509 [Triparma verrucosa]|uniref:PH domain-containing protein n=2 Tax=Triparma TaxID=722752 RepID=A0A9W7EL74_9STRA|nr:hypothetical protein TrST_g5832 [Triparma strigata]GMH83264.1 hypothetical protein TrVE_jg6509 [Triparma verrucosa]|mmetsp:Transcript_15151/g.28222  ORF Transcript_15151/g.28222 Transcript_15151/m.28222 type:complete len:151 (+) Transcript_15151:106-558(+)
MPGRVRPAYTDSSTNIRYDCSNGEFEGWLTKQSAWLKDWRRRFFILKGSKLFFSKSESGSPHGMIDLATCTTVKSAELKAQKRNALEVSTPLTTFLMYADTEKEKDDWIGGIGKAIVRCSSTFHDDGEYESEEEGEEESEEEDDESNPYR